MLPSDVYSKTVRNGALSDDAAQRSALLELDRVAKEIIAAGQKKKTLLSAFSQKKPQIPGLYLWGGVGRGKSMLMDLFYDSLERDDKRRVHFHAFMQEVHDALHEVRKTGVDDAIRPVAQEIAARTGVLCFDEMQITDITDAMIVGRLFEKLFEDGCVIVTTSNRPPEDLYKDGLNRDLFLPFIALLQDRLVTHEIGATRDYRQDRIAGETVYFAPADQTARARIDAIWADLTNGASAPLTLRVKGRDVTIPSFHNGAGRARFFDLCGLPLGPADYLAIAEAVKLLIVENIPRLSRSNFNEAKRFVTLIDTLYEARTRLICSAADVPDRLYLEGEGVFEFARTASRLQEMQSADWS